MPSPLKNWELKNIEFFLIEFLRLKLRDIPLTISVRLDERDENEHVMTIKCSDTARNKKELIVPLDESHEIKIKIKPVKGKLNDYKIYIQSLDLLLLRHIINLKILKIMNLYLLGEAVQEWILHEQYVHKDAPVARKLSNTPHLRLFQQPKLKSQPGMIEKLQKTFSFIYSELTDFVVPDTFIIPLEVNAKKNIGGKITHAKHEGKIYIDFTKYSYPNLLDYQNQRCHSMNGLISVTYWIENALHNSIYNSQQFRIVQKLDRIAKNKYTMLISVDVSIKLPIYLSIMLDKHQVLLKTRYLGSQNKDTFYKFTLSFEAVCFLNAYFYKRICDALKPDFRPEIQEKSHWAFYKADNDDLVSKVCLLANMNVSTMELITLEDIKSIWLKLTGKILANEDVCPALYYQLGGTVEIIRNDKKEIIGLFYNVDTLNKILSYNQPFMLYLPPTPTAEPELEDNFKGNFARAFDGSALAKKSQKKQLPEPPSLKKSKFAELATQSPLSTCIFDETSHPIKHEDISEIFPKGITAANLTFFKQQKPQEIKPNPKIDKHEPTKPLTRKRSRQLQEGKGDIKEVEPAQRLSSSL